MLQGPNVREVAFARLLLLDGRRVMAIYSKRFYGTDAQSELTTWFKGNAVPIEKVLSSWNGIPSRDQLKSPAPDAVILNSARRARPTTRGPSDLTQRSRDVLSRVARRC